MWEGVFVSCGENLSIWHGFLIQTLTRPLPLRLQKQRIYLLGVPSGVGRIVFSAAQFATFLQHPLMLAAAATAVQVCLRCWTCVFGYGHVLQETAWTRV